MIKFFFSKIIFELKYILSPSDYSSKVFCIGYNKTGTTSVGKAFEMLGYRNSSFNKKNWNNYKKGDISSVLKYTSKFDSFDDLPWLKEDMIPLLDKTFPNSKFVYLEREEEEWKQSFFTWRMKVFSSCPDMEIALSNFRKHQKFVLEYFKNRAGDFLIINVSDENSFVKLADFLEKKTEFKKMPHVNKS